MKNQEEQWANLYNKEGTCDMAESYVNLVLPFKYRDYEVEEIIKRMEIELRRKFDHCALETEAVDVIVEARQLGYVELAANLIYELSHSGDMSKDFVYDLIAKREQRLPALIENNTPPDTPPLSVDDLLEPLDEFELKEGKGCDAYHSDKELNLEQ